jgi:hypothetical protein
MLSDTRLKLVEIEKQYGVILVRSTECGVNNLITNNKRLEHLNFNI